MNLHLSRIKKPAVWLSAGILSAAVAGLAVLSSSGSAAAAPAAASNNSYFLKIDGIPGESADARHAGEIELNSFEWGPNGAPGLEQPGAVGAGGGGGAGKVKVNDISFTAKVNSASPKLLSASASGKHIKEAVLTVRRGGDKQQDYLVVKLGDVLVSSYRIAGNDGDVPTDRFSLNFAKIEMNYANQKADGSAGSPAVGGWDFKANEDL